MTRRPKIDPLDSSDVRVRIEAVNALRRTTESRVEPYLVTDGHWAWMVNALHAQHAIDRVLEKCPDCGSQCMAAPVRLIVDASPSGVLHGEGFDLYAYQKIE